MDVPSHNVSVEPIIHIGNLSYKATVKELQDLFSSVLKPKNVVINAKVGGLSKFGFATFENVEECEIIIKKFNYYSLHNKQINLILYNENKKFIREANIFVKNLPLNLNSRDLNEIFKMFGSIVCCKAASDADGNLKGYGFVQYSNAKSARRAMANCQNVKIGNNALEVEMYNHAIHEDKKGNADKFTNCYIKNIPADMDESKLMKVLEKYGEVTSLFFPLKDDSSPVGHACANFSRHEDADRAIKELNGTYVLQSESKNNGLPFYIQRWESRKERNEMLQKISDFSITKGQRCKGNLYVSNIPINFSNEEILNIFSKFGHIYDYKIHNFGGPKQLKYGYICYQTIEEAAVAFERIDGTYLDGNKLQVSFYKSKEKRENERNKKINTKYHEMTKTGNDEDIVPDKAIKINDAATKNIKLLYSKLMRKAEEWKPFWEKLKINSKSAFALTITLSITQSPYFSVEELVSQDDLLNTYVEKYINDKGRFVKTPSSKNSSKFSSLSEKKINN